MANNYNDVITQAAVIGTIFDNITTRPLRPKYIFDALAQERQWALTTAPKKGDTMQFPVLSALSSNTAALVPTTTTITGSQTSSYVRRTVTLTPYGDHAVVDMFEYEPEAFVDAIGDMAFLMADQAMNSLNVIAKAAMDLNKYANEVSGTLSGTYHYYGSAGTASTMGPMKAKDVRKIVAQFKGDNVQPYEDGMYRCVLDPIQSTQLRAETGNAAWRAPQVYKDSVREIFTGEVGEFEGVRFIVNNQVTGNGTGTISSYFMGREFVGKALGKDVQVGTHSRLYGPQENNLVINWNSLVGYKIIRRESGIILETSNDQL